MSTGKTIKTCLRSGDELTIRILEPPLGGYTDDIEYWWSDVRGPLMAGEYSATSLDRFIVGEVAGEYVGSMTYATPRHFKEAAVLGMVWTRPDQRRKGIAAKLLQEALASFRALGGMAMYLCTTNPHAYALYYSQGFRPLIGDGMRCLTPGHEDFDRTFFASNGTASIRSANWGDLASVSALYNQQQPNWLIKDYPRRVFHNTRYEGHYRQVWLPTQQRLGTVLVLENSAHRVVGIASAVPIDSYFEQHVQMLDGWVCPAYLSQFPELLSAVVESSRANGTEMLQAHIANTDLAKQEAFEKAGLRQEARLHNRVRLGEDRIDLLMYSCPLNKDRPPAQPEASYYGARPVFQEQE